MKMKKIAIVASLFASILILSAYGTVDQGISNPADPWYVTTADGGVLNVSVQSTTASDPNHPNYVIISGVDGGLGTASNPIYEIRQAPSTGGMGTVQLPESVNNLVPCPDVANKSGMVVYLTPDAGQNCMLIKAGIRNRTYVTSNMCINPNGTIPTCSSTAVSTGVRLAADSPEEMPFTGTAVAADGGTYVDGGVQYLNMCALPSSATGTFEYVPMTNCYPTP
jgi:hypothetical protein